MIQLLTSTSSLLLALTTENYLFLLQIIFPGVSEYSFHKLLCYLYTDEIPAISADKCLNLLELANRLCLPRLLNLVECRVIEDLTKLSQNESAQTIEHCLKLLEPVKVRCEKNMWSIEKWWKNNWQFLFRFSILFVQSISCTMLISWRNGVCHIYVSIIILFVNHHRRA